MNYTVAAQARERERETRKRGAHREKERGGKKKKKKNSQPVLAPAVLIDVPRGTVHRSKQPEQRKKAREPSPTSIFDRAFVCCQQQGGATNGVSPGAGRG
jgi:hypothetical protein